MSRFPAMTSPNALLQASELAHLSSRAPRWRPGSAAAHPHHSEVFAGTREASGAAAALALAADALAAADLVPGTEAEDRRSLLWVQDREALRRGGRPYRPGLPPGFRHRLIHVACDKPEDALFALEEGLRCREICAVIGEIAGNPRALDFTASRRLTLTAEKHGVPLWLVRLDARRDLSSARMRWDVRAAPSPRPRWNADAPGTPAWQAELFRARAHPPGTWTLRDDPSGLVADPFAAADRPPYPLGLAFAAGDRSLAAV
ncbi:recA-like protein [Tsuneonella amylolytica]|uniref:recA-like protein n=1 Tax=Tsuneonella amylolytica TaxID=2338327 RepID=UPI001F26C483|nr:recA-like protein [Tsuneonella amylolytica]